MSISVKKLYRDQLLGLVMKITISDQCSHSKSNIIFFFIVLNKTFKLTPPLGGLARNFDPSSI